MGESIKAIGTGNEVYASWVQQLSSSIVKCSEIADPRVEFSNGDMSSKLYRFLKNGGYK